MSAENNIEVDERPKPFKGLPILETNRLRLRELRLEEVETYYRYHIDEEALDYYDWLPHDLAEAEESITSIRNDYVEQKYINWGIALKECDTLIGDCGLFIADSKGELNYMLDRKHWGQGYMEEALTAVVGLCFDHTHLYRVQAMTLPDNTSSRRLLTKLGFSEEGILRQYGFNAVRQAYIDLMMWSILKGEFIARWPLAEKRPYLNITYKVF